MGVSSLLNEYRFDNFHFWKKPKPCYDELMTKILQQAFNKLATLPTDTQDQLGERLLQWNQLRASIDHARQQAANGDVAPLNAENIIQKARAQHAGS